MKSTNGWPRLRELAGPDDPFDELRASYHARLRSDNTRLKMLHTQLFRPEVDPQHLFEAIRLVAHGMAGAAAVFEVTEVLDAAIALEQAALAAMKAHADNADPAMRAALDGLTNLLQSICV